MGATSESLPDAVTFTRELIETTAETIPVLGFLLKKGSQWALDRGKQAWLEKTRPQLQAFYRDGLLIEDHEMSDLMPWMLAQDLNQHLAKYPRDRFVLFVDEYERVMDGAGTGARWRENRFDAHMRQFISETRACGAGAPTSARRQDLSGLPVAAADPLCPAAGRAGRGAGRRDRGPYRGSHPAG